MKVSKLKLGCHDMDNMGTHNRLWPTALQHLNKNSSVVTAVGFQAATLARFHPKQVPSFQVDCSCHLVRLLAQVWLFYKPSKGSGDGWRQ
jgi:hypothetical protein